MAISLFRRGNTATNNSYKGTNGEITINTTTKAIRIHDGVTTGGFEGARRDLTNILPTGPINFNGQAITNVVVDTTGELTATSLQTNNISSLTESGTLTFNSPTNFDSVVNINDNLKLNSYGLDTVTLTLNHDDTTIISLDSKSGGVGIGGTLIVTGNLTAQTGITTLGSTSISNDTDVYGNLTLQDSNLYVLNDSGQSKFIVSPSTSTTTVVGTLEVNDTILVDNITEYTLNHGVIITNNTTIQGSTTTDSLTVTDALSSSSSLTDISSTLTNITSNTISIQGYVSQVGDYDISGNFTIDGNFSILGTLSTLHSENVSVKDTLIILNDEIGNANPVNDSGVIIDRGSQDNAGMFWSESQHKFAFITASSIGGTSVGNLLTTGGTISYAGLLAGEIDLKDNNGDLVFNVNNAGDVHVYGDLIVDGGLSGNADTATSWATAMTLNLTGAVSGSVSFDGSATANITTTFGTITLGTDTTGAYVESINAGTGIEVSNVGNIYTIDLADGVIASPSTYNSVTVDTYGRVTAGSNPTTLAGYGISDAQPLDATLTGLASVSTNTDKLIYANGVDSFTTTDLSSFGRSLIDDADASAARTTLGLVIGTNVQAYDPTLAGIASVTASSDKLIYANGNDTFTTTDLSSFGRSLIDDADAGTARSTLGLAIGTNVQAYDPTLLALAGVTTSANKLIYATDSDVFTTTDLTAHGRTLIGGADADATKTTLGLVIGTNVQAYDATLNALAGLSTVADQTIYSTGVDTFAMTNLSAFGRSLIDDADANTARTTLGLAIGTNVQAYDATLAGLATVSTSSDTLIYATGVDTFTTTTITTFGRSLIDDTDASTARTTLGLAIGTNVQAYDATLNALAGLTTSADQTIYSTGVDTFAMTTLSSFGRTLIDDADASTARTTLGLGTIATQNSTAFVDTTTSQSIAGTKTFTGDIAFSGSGKITLSSTSVATTQTALNNSTAVATTAYVQTATRVTTDQKTANYTLVISDEGKMIEFNSASNLTLTIPANSSVAFPVGTQILISRLGTGTVQVLITTDTLYSVSSNRFLASRYSGATLVKTTSTTWYLFGDLSAT